MIREIERLLTISLVVLVFALVCKLIQPQRPQTPDLTAEEMQEYADAASSGTELPQKYDARLAGKMTTVKDQGMLGTCWAMATSSALEAGLLPEEQLIFSPDHISMQNSFARGQNEGGQYRMAMAYLAGWQGPVLEESDPYGDGVSVDGLAPVKHVQEIQMYENRDLTAIKRAVLEYGAVQSALYMDMRQSGADSEYYRRDTAAYCYTGEEHINHDVLIIGWDDAYPAENFSMPAAVDGAFLCQNSWGAGFGEQGVFYVSYEDAHLGETAVAYTRIEDADNYANIYQTDLCGWTGQIGYGDSDCYFANVFTAQGVETLQAVGFYATGKNTQYDVYVLENCTEPKNVLLEEPLAHGTVPEIGYYTIPLEKTVDWEPGEACTVVVKVRTPGSIYPVAVERVSDELTKTVDIFDGAGYISHDGFQWTDTQEAQECNVCMKAYTANR